MSFVGDLRGGWLTAGIGRSAEATGGSPDTLRLPARLVVITARSERKVVSDGSSLDRSWLPRRTASGGEASMRRLIVLLRRWRLLLAVPLILGACGGGPLGTPGCSVAGISDVLTALENVPGYTFIASGTSLTVKPRAPGGSARYEYQSPRIELRGAYRAPDRSRLEVVAGRDAIPPVTDPGVFFLGAEAIIVIGDRTWLVSPGAATGGQQSEPGGSNLLLELLRGAPEAGEVQWSGAGACSFSGLQRRDLGSLGALNISLQVEVRPGALPHKIVEEMQFDRPDQPRHGYTLTYLPDFGETPDIVAPGR